MTLHQFPIGVDVSKATLDIFTVKLRVTSRLKITLALLQLGSTA
jgi:hypothetical protein